MSLFGTYIQEAIELQNKKTEIDLDESYSNLSYAYGEIVAEMSNFDTLIGLQESCIPVVFNEAVNNKIEKIKTRFREFIQKAIEFYSDMISTINEKIIDKLSKIKKGTKLKKDIVVYDYNGDKNRTEMYRLCRELEPDILDILIKDVDLAEIDKRLGEFEALCKKSDKDFGGYTKELKAGDDAVVDLSMYKSEIKNCNDTIKRLKEAIKEDKKDRKEEAFDKACVDTYNRLIRFNSARIAFDRKINKYLMTSAKRILFAI